MSDENVAKTAEEIEAMVAVSRRRMGSPSAVPAPAPAPAPEPAVGELDETELLIAVSRRRMGR